MDPYTLETPESQENQGFHALLRFLRVVRRHKAILFGFVAAAVFLSIVYHKRTPKEYEASAKLMVRQLRSAATEHDPQAANGLLSSYRQLLLSDNVLLGTVDLLKARPPELIVGSSARSEWPKILRKNLISVSFDDEGDVLDVRCRSRSAESTVQVIQALTAASSQFMESFQKNEALETVKNLDQRRDEIEEQLFEREKELLDARKACGDILVNEKSEDSHPLVQRVNHLNAELTKVRRQRLELQSMLVSAQQQVAAQGDLTLPLQKLQGLVGENVMSQLPGMSARDPKILQALKDNLTKMATELSALRRHYGSGHSDVVRREFELGIQRRRVVEAEQEEVRNVQVGVRDPQVGQWLISTISAELNAQIQYEHSLQAEFNNVEQEALHFSDKVAGIQLAERQVETLRQSHTSLLNRLTSINIQPDGGVFKVAVLTEPLVPSNPAYPILSRILAGFVAIGVVLSLGIIYVIDLLDDRLRSPEEVRDELGLSVLGVIRKLPEAEIQQAKIYVHGFPQTPHAECFRTLKTAISLSAMDTKCLAVTSTEASEGKTTTTVNLAASYAQTGVRTLLIDADMRRPGLSRLLEVRGHGGLSEVLRAESDIPEMCRERVVKTEVPLLDVLPCGPRILNAGMLLSMPTLAEVLDWAVSEYDQVIVDCPPTLPVSDAAIVGRFVDSMLFLMNPDKTHRRSVARAVDQLRAMHLKIVGIVANTSQSEDQNSYGYGYGYGYGADYSYGHDDDEFEGADDSEVVRRAA